MKILNHKLVGIDYKPSPSQSGLVVPKYLVIHYTAGRGFEATQRTFLNKESEVSAHLLIGRNGEIVQMVPFNKKAWHAGTSEWKNQKGLNALSIGIELDNYGKLTRMADGSWQTYFNRKVPDSEVVIARHKHGGPMTGWHAYTEKQLDVLEEVSVAIFNHYKLEDVLGHEDISKGRKSDPGPAFNMASFRTLLLGRKSETDDREPDDFKNEIPDFIFWNNTTGKMEKPLK
jgi:N-acetylmuramoyl-L-alanine amidase